MAMLRNRIRNLLVVIFVLLSSACSPDSREQPDVVQPYPLTGAFVETDITPDLPEGYRIWRSFNTEDTLECVAVSNGRYRIYTSYDAGASWDERPDEWQDGFEEQMVFLEAIGPDRSIWLYTWDMAKNEIWRVSADGTLSTFPMPDGARKIQQILPLAGDRVLITHMTGAGLETESHTTVYDSRSGEACYSIPQDGPGTYRASETSIYLHQVYFYEENRIYLATHDIETGEKIEQNTGLYDQGMIPSPLAADSSGYYYYINNDGLNRFAPGGAVTEVLLNSGRYSFQQDGYYTLDLNVQDEQAIYICLGSANLSVPGLLLKYTYDENAPLDETPARITPEGSAYSIRYDVGHNSFSGGLIRHTTDGAELLTGDAFLIVFATDDGIVFRRQDGDFFTQSKHPWYCATLHYYDLNTGDVVDIFTDSYHKWKEHSQEPYEGQVLSANLDQNYPYYDPHYTLSGGNLLFYVTRIDDGFVDQYEYDLGSRELTLLKSVAIPG